MIFGFPLPDLMTIVAISFAICTTVCTLAIGAAVIFTPAFLFVFPDIITGFPSMTPAEAIGLSLFIEVFGYTSSIGSYWYRGQVDFRIAAKILVLAIPVAIAARAMSFIVPSEILMLLFGLLLVVLAGILYKSHHHSDLSLFSLVPWMSSSSAFPGSTQLSPISNSERLSAAPVTDEYEARTEIRGDGRGFDLDLGDNLIVAGGATLAGLIGIAMGEVSQTFLNVRKHVPIKISTGTSALVLHVTILSALAATITLMFVAPDLAGHAFKIPLRVGLIIAPVVLVGGSVGAYINSRLSDETTLWALILSYFLVGAFVVIRTLFIGGGH